MSCFIKDIQIEDTVVGMRVDELEIGVDDWTAAVIKSIEHDRGLYIRHKTN